jgi:HD-like signal output (HDOD) protein/prolyl-tRNA editing enzyme YbaK/EbsC (Cys-tRNA(Pro) deacylase)
MNVGIESYLSQQGMEYQIEENTAPTTIGSEAVFVRAILFRDELGLLMAILPADHFLNYDKLCQILGRDLTPLTKEELANLYGEYRFDFIPPIPEILGAVAVVAEGLDAKREIYFLPGSADKIMRVNVNGKNSLWNKANYASFSEPISNLDSPKRQEAKHGSFNQFVAARMKKRIEETYEIPSMPHIARDLMALRVNTKATAEDLARVVENDPSLVTQIISWARSPYYGYTGKIESVEDAIIRVLGYELVMNLALGLSLGQCLHVPLEGSLGLRAYWLESMYAAVTMHSLALRMKVPQRPLLGLVHLGGMLHNFGRLILAHLFIPQFKKLELATLANPHVPISIIEQQVIGIQHEELAEWALDHWHLPEEVIVCATHHHEDQYQGPHENYVKLINLALRMMKQHGFGDGDQVQISEELVNELGLTFEDIAQVEKQIFSHKDEMVRLSKQMLGE